MRHPALIAPVSALLCAAAAPPSSVVVESRSVPVIVADGLRFRDLDRNGRLTPYEDWRLPPATRAADLVARMTLAEKAGAVMHGNLPGAGSALGASTTGYDMAQVRDLVEDRHVTTFITRLAVSPEVMSEQNNAVQAIAERGRLGIPVMVSSDPRHHFQSVLGASVGGRGYSRWPEPLGFAALRDAALLRRFADVARSEYRATGIHQALSPQADLVTEPRWSRGTATFGADPALARTMVQAYVAGFQGGSTGVGREGVLATVKHWVAYGATPDGWDGHNRYGRFARVDDGSFRRHLEPFTGAFAAKVGAVMPTYSIVQGAHVAGRSVEPVGAGFSRLLLTDLLRGTYGFDGLVVSDWAITNDCTARCSAPTAAAPQRPQDIAMPWGVEGLTRLQRFARGLNAGLDQFGGVAEPGLIVEAVRRGLVSGARLDRSVARVMEAKFALGLFDDPFVDPAAAARDVNPDAVQAEAQAVQAAAQVLLKDPRGLLPLKPGTRVLLRGIDPAAARAAGLMPVTDPAAAEVAVARIDTPFERPHPHHFFGSRQNEGRLDFAADNADLAAVRELAAHVPVIAALFLDRPAVLGPMNDAASAILANFGVGDAALLASLTGRAPPRGRLPFELPSSMAAVVAQDPARPDDSRHPLYPFGAGIVGTSSQEKPS